MLPEVEDVQEAEVGREDVGEDVAAVGDAWEEQEAAEEDAVGLEEVVDVRAEAGEAEDA